jgi:hypothetical protein
MEDYYANFMDVMLRNNGIGSVTENENPECDQLSCIYQEKA